MEIVICRTAEEASRAAADLIAGVVKEKPRCVLGLATGATPLRVYDRLAEAVAAKEISFRRVRTWNLDEYVGLAPDHPQSYRRFMDDNLFGRIDIRRSNTHVLDGLAADWRAECAAYEAAIRRAGGIDLQLLGIGADGHIGFNEPASSLASRTRIVALTPQTVRDNARFFASADEVPRYALSMGVGTICEARRVALLAFGAHKAAAVAAAVEGAMSQFCTASALQAHPDAWFFCDAAAAAKLKLRKYYAWRAEAARARLTEGGLSCKLEKGIPAKGKRKETKR